MRLAFFGGIYSNHLALSAAIADARSRGVDGIWCLGDLGAFGPHPDRTCELIRENDISVIQGNYDHSIGHALDDCRCGYMDPRDNHFAQISYDYTLEKTSQVHRDWMKSLPDHACLEIEGQRLRLCHGSPRRTNEFLWESTTSTPFLDRLCQEFNADIILGTHTGLHWDRRLSGGQRFVNVGVLGRPANDGQTNVWYTLLTIGSARTGERSQRQTGTNLTVEFIPVAYESDALAAEMRAEGLPGEFVETILTGWWTTCLEILPAKERRRGRW